MKQLLLLATTILSAGLIGCAKGSLSSSLASSKTSDYIPATSGSAPLTMSNESQVHEAQEQSAQAQDSIAAESCYSKIIGSKPNTAQFLAAAKTDASNASSILYGVIGANGDGRNWDQIMASSDPLSAARAATFAMYNGPYCRAPFAVRAPFIQGDFELKSLAQVGNYQFQEQRQISTGQVNYWVAQVDGDSYMLTTFANCSVISKRAINFGSGIEPVRQLQALVQSMNISAYAKSYFYSGCF